MIKKNGNPAKTRAASGPLIEAGLVDLGKHKSSLEIVIEVKY